MLTDCAIAQTEHDLLYVYQRMVSSSHIRLLQQILTVVRLICHYLKVTFNELFSAIPGILAEPCCHCLSIHCYIQCIVYTCIHTVVVVLVLV